jgi:hypothetical protein
MLLPIPRPRIPYQQPALSKEPLGTRIQDANNSRHSLQAHVGQTTEGDSGHPEPVPGIEVHL